MNYLSIVEKVSKNDVDDINEIIVGYFIPNIWQFLEDRYDKVNYFFSTTSFGSSIFFLRKGSSYNFTMDKKERMKI